eukprot:scaffold12430_cov137-Skeletonema_marinoi.AAC.36
MSEEEGSGGSEAGGYVPPIALLKSNGSDGSSGENTIEAKSDASSPDVAADPEKTADEKHDEDAKDEDLSISAEPLKPAAESPAAPATEEGGSAGGLFAGLSLSPSASGNLKSAASTAPPPSSSSAETESTEHQPSSRAVTPVHSNAAPPTTTSPESAKEKVDSLDNENTTQVNKTPLVKRGSAGSSTSEKAPPSSSKTNHKPKPTTTSTPKTTTIDLLLQVTILPPSSKKSSSSPTTTLTNTDTTLRLLRKFHTKSAPSIPQHAGGTQPVSWYGWMFGPSVETAGNEDPALKCFHDFTEALGVNVSEGEDDGDVASSTTASANSATAGGEEDVIVESILGHKDDSPSKARDTLASFIQLVHCWCLTSAQVAEALLEKGSSEDGAKSQDGVVTEELLSLAISTASSLVAHGCLDDLYVNIGHADKTDGSGGSAAERAGETQEIDEILDSTVDSVGAPSL